jgi:hypothetical protein
MFSPNVDYKNMRLTSDLMKTPNNYHISLMVYLKKITIGCNWTKIDTHVMHDNDMNSNFP